MEDPRQLGVKLKLQIDVVLHHDELGRYDVEQRLFVRKRRGESMQHVVMKLLSYLLFYRDDLEIEAGVGQHYKPDLVSVDERGDPVVWIDCGTTSLKKLESLVSSNPGTEIVIVKQREGELRRYAREAQQRLGQEASVQFVAFGDNLVDRLARMLGGRHRLEATVPEGMGEVYLSVDGREIRGEVVGESESRRVGEL